MKRAISGLLILALCAGVLAGCKNDTADVYVPTGDALVMDDGQLAGAPEKTPSDQDLTLVYYPDVTLNPIACTDITNRVLFSLLYQSLFVVDRGYNVAPMLCGSYRISDDMQRYTFYLDPSATYSDGSRVTAGDVVASLEAARLSTYYSGRFTRIKEITLTEDGGIQIRTNTPMENLPILLDIPIIKESQLDSLRPVGSGPYYMDESGEKLVLRKRTDWWCSAEMTVTAEAIALAKAEDNPQIRDEFEFGELDLVCANPASDRYTDYRCDYELWDSETGTFLYLGCNIAGAIFSNEQVRAALTYAIDRETIAAENYRGFARVASLPASPASPYYSEVLASKYTYDGGVKLRQAVVEAGMNGKSLTLLVNADDTMRTRIARSIGHALEEAGFKVTVKDVSGNTYRYALRNYEFDLYLGQTRLSANMDLTPFFSSKGAVNYGALADAGLYALCAESMANIGNYYSLHQAVMNDGRLCPILFSSYAVYATRGLLTDLTPARDNIFHYTLDKTMSDILLKETPAPEPKEPAPAETQPTT